MGVSASSPILSSNASSNDNIVEGWFIETGEMWPGQATAIKTTSIIYRAKSQFQDIMVVDTASYGRMMVLDGVIQSTERDEFAYQEMMTHPALFSHAYPQSVLIIGGGDGGVLREVVKHLDVAFITLCEIDESVVTASKQYLSHMSSAFNDPRVNVIIGDGVAFLNDKIQMYDIIIVDSSDPIGPAECLFQRPFYELLAKALKPGGVVVSQCECMWLHLNVITTLLSFCRKLFCSVDYCWASIPTYPSGTIGFLLCRMPLTEEPLPPIGIPLSRPSTLQQAQLNYYNPDIHTASFVLPEFVRRAFASETIFE